MNSEIVSLPGMDMGESAIRISLLNGKVVVYHGFTDEVLAEGVAKDGFWDSLWSHIEGNLKITYRHEE